jgi:8-oxo-dGTP pyrophosphatase MutT (NUDIX family)
MISKEKPDDFKKQFDIVGCLLEYDGKIVLLRRQLHKASGNKWGLPAGKMDAGESTLQAILREVKEETGLTLPEASLKYFDSFYVKDGSLDLEWHMFQAKLDTPPIIKINPEEHLEYCWATPKEALQMDLIHGLPESIQFFYKI